MNKKNFLLNTEYFEMINSLSDSDSGKLFKGIFNYVITGDSELEGYLKTIFIPFKQFIDKNEETYQKKCEKNKENGANGGAPKGNKNAKKKENNPKQPKTTQNNPKQHDIYHNHISYITNHNSDISLEDREYERKKPLEASEDNLLSETSKKVIEHLNEKTNSKFRYSSNVTQTKINARLNEGYKLGDFIVVIDKKCEEWIGTEYEKFLCPETLFGTKFEKYLNQKINNKSETKKIDSQINILKGVYDGQIKIN